MPNDPASSQTPFSQKVGEKESRKLKAQRTGASNVWTGLGLFGMVGWSVVIPTLLGTALGIWLDKTYPQPFSWTLTGLVTGLLAGCTIAWNWVGKENKHMHKNAKRNDD